MLPNGQPNNSQENENMDRSPEPYVLDENSCLYFKNMHNPLKGLIYLDGAKNMDGNFEDFRKAQPAILKRRDNIQKRKTIKEKRQVIMKYGIDKKKGYAGSMLDWAVEKYGINEKAGLRWEWDKILAKENNREYLEISQLQSPETSYIFMNDLSTSVLMENQKANAPQVNNQQANANESKDTKTEISLNELANTFESSNSTRSAAEERVSAFKPCGNGKGKGKARD